MQKESFFTHHTLMELDKIKNLIFDFGGVLVDLDKARCLQAFARLGFTQAAGMIDAYSQQGLFGQLEEGTISPDHFCREVRRLTGIQVRDEDIWQAWNLFLVDIPAWKLEALIGLRKHFPIYLLSNTNVIHWQHAVNNLFPHGKWRVEDYFNRIFLSYELHQVKPGADIFHTVIAQSGIRPEETLFIDDAAANCATAASVGLHTYQPQPHEDWRKLFAGVLDA